MQSVPPPLSRRATPTETAPELIDQFIDYRSLRQTAAMEHESAEAERQVTDVKSISRR